MRKQILLRTLFIILIFYIIIVGTSIFRVKTGKLIEMKVSEPKFYKQVEISLPAVEEDGKGTMVSLKVQLNKGEGRVLLEIDSISFWEDTQRSIRVAKSVAEKITNKDTSDYDIIYSIFANASKIEGPSAGPSIAIATIIALNNETINNSVAITGYLREDGTIAKVSGVLAKAEAAKENGIKLFLVPLGQRVQPKTETKKNCKNSFLINYCTTETIERMVDIQEEVGIDVIEVKNISDALKYFVID